MDEIWVLAAGGGYGGYGEPGDVACDDAAANERFFFATEDAALAYLAAQKYPWGEPRAYRLTRGPTPIPDAAPDVHLTK